MSTDSTIQRPRKKPAPSARDQELYVAYQTTGLTQTELAGQYGLTQCRVSQIVRRVEAWRATANPQPGAEAPGERTVRQQQRLDRWLERERSEAILRDALRHFNQPQQVKTTKTGPRGEEVTVRELPANVQWLKVAQRANQQLFQREALEPVPPEEPDAKERRKIMFEELQKLRASAQAGGKVGPRSDPYSFVHLLLEVIQGDLPQYALDHGLLELARGLIAVAQRLGLEPVPTSRSEAGPPETGSIGAEATTSSTSPLADELPQRAAAAEVATEIACETNSAPTNSPLLNPVRRTPEPGLVPAQKDVPVQKEPEDDALNRRLRHYEKLEQLKAARRRGLPCMFVFDPADGPLPPPHYSLDGAESG